MSRKVLQSLSLILFAAVFALPSFAQQAASAATWRIDTDLSVSRLSLGSADQNSVVAVAQVRGAIDLEPTHDPASIAFEVSPAGTDSAAAYPKFAFRSRSVRLGVNGTLIADGDLTVTSIEQRTTLDANEGYSGPVYSEPAVTRITRHVTFVFDAQAARADAKGPLDLSATGVLATEDFPGLREVVLETNWPIVAFDRNCESPYDANEGYQAPVCTGTALSVPKSHEVPSTVSAEDNQTLDTVSAPAGNKIIIALQLHLDRAGQSAPAPQPRSAD